MKQITQQQIEEVIKEFSTETPDGPPIFDIKRAVIAILETRAQVEKEKENHINLIRQFRDMT